MLVLLVQLELSQVGAWTSDLWPTLGHPLYNSTPLSLSFRFAQIKHFDHFIYFKQNFSRSGLTGSDRIGDLLGIPCESWVLLLRRGLWLVVTLGVNLPLGPLGNLALLWENAAPLVRRDIRLVPLLANPAKEKKIRKINKFSEKCSVFLVQNTHFYYIALRK